MKNYRLFLRSACAGFLLISLSSGAEELSGKIVRILDGDTVELVTLPANVPAVEVPVRVRLNGIDAPEKNRLTGSARNSTLPISSGGSG